MFAREIAPAGHLVGAGHDRARRRPAVGVAADQALRVPARQGARSPVGVRARRRAPCGAIAAGRTAAAARAGAPSAPRRRGQGGDGAGRACRLIRLAWARSGDKGDLSNIGLVARRPEWLPLLWARVTPERVRRLVRAPGATARSSASICPASHAMNLAAARRARRRRPVVDAHGSARQGHGADAAGHADRGAALDRTRGARRRNGMSHRLSLTPLDVASVSAKRLRSYVLTRVQGVLEDAQTGSMASRPARWTFP